MNVPNILTLSRLGLAVVMMALLSVNIPFARSMALLVFVFAGITDYLDGYLARNVYGVTSFGRLMDPLTDKVLVCAAFVSFVELKITPAWIVVIIISREFLVTGLRLLAASQGRSDRGRQVGQAQDDLADRRDRGFACSGWRFATICSRTPTPVPGELRFLFRLLSRWSFPRRSPSSRWRRASFISWNIATSFRAGDVRPPDNDP